MPGENTGSDIDVVTWNCFIIVYTNRNSTHNATWWGVTCSFIIEPITSCVPLTDAFMNFKWSPRPPSATTYQVWILEAGEWSVWAWQSLKRLKWKPQYDIFICTLAVFSHIFWILFYQYFCSTSALCTLFQYEQFLGIL